jgi:type I restriction enzyme M protein
LILRHKAAKPAERQGKVLFINADREYREGRAQNFLEPEHIEKIVAAYREFDDIPAFAKVVTRQELAENDYNLNIRRYVDTTPPPEPQDVRAHLHGGIPRTEVEAKSELFTTHGLDVTDLLVDRDADYFEFATSFTAKRQLRDLIETNEGVIQAETVVTQAIEGWWKTEQDGFAKLRATADLIDLRKHLVASFQSTFAPIGMLDRFQISGIIASWWGDNQADLKTLATIGFKGLIEAWGTTVLDALEEEKSKVDPLDHKVARALLPEYLDGLASIEAEAAELDAAIKAVTAKPEDEDVDEPEEEVSPAELKKLKAKLTASKKQLKADKAAFAQKLSAASQALDDTAARELVLDLFQTDILAVAHQRVTRHRRNIINAFETWWDKYQVTLTDLETERDSAADRLAEFLKDLGYE